MVKKITQKTVNSKVKKATITVKMSKTTQKSLPKRKIVVDDIKQTISKDSLNHVIGKAIAKYRKAAGLSQEKLAEELGLRNEAVSRMERGIVIPTVERLIEMAEIFDCPVSELLTESSNRPTDEAMHLHHLLSTVTEENKQWLMEQFEQWVYKLVH